MRDQRFRRSDNVWHHGWRRNELPPSVAAGWRAEIVILSPVAGAGAVRGAGPLSLVSSCAALSRPPSAVVPRAASRKTSVGFVDAPAVASHRARPAWPGAAAPARPAPGPGPGAARVR